MRYTSQDAAFRVVRDALRAALAARVDVGDAYVALDDIELALARAEPDPPEYATEPGPHDYQPTHGLE